MRDRRRVCPFYPVSVHSWTAPCWHPRRSHVTIERTVGNNGRIDVGRECGTGSEGADPIDLREGVFPCESASCH
jgi:hypothetical protein